MTKSEEIMFQAVSKLKNHGWPDEAIHELADLFISAAFQHIKEMRNSEVERNESLIRRATAN